MACTQYKTTKSDIQAILLDDPDFLLDIVEGVLQQHLDNEVTADIGANPHNNPTR